MDFAALPPEINSVRMYAGAGSGPMLAAAAAWDGLAAELQSTATAYGSVISGLTSQSWLGPSSASMAAAATPYVAWLTTTATQAEKTAAQAKAAAGAYETAFAMTVPPPVIAANRSLLMSLVTTNVLGQNTPTISATEAQYGEMWAQDAAAMYGYAGSSATATQVTPFTPAPRTTNPAGATAQASGTSAGTGAQAAMSQLTTAVPQTLQGLAAPPQVTPAATVSTLATPGLIAPLAAPAAPLAAPGLPGFTDVLGLSPASSALSAAGLGVSGGAFGASEFAGQEASASREQIYLGQRDILDALGRPGGPEVAGTASLPAPVSASMGRASSAGGLSVPQGWAAAAPAIRPVAMSLPATSVGATPAALTGTSGTAFSEMALAGMAGRALGGTVSPGRRAVSPGRRERVGAKTRERTEPPQRSPASPLTGIAAELRELAALRDSGILTDGEFNEQKRRLLGH